MAHLGRDARHVIHVRRRAADDEERVRDEEDAGRSA